MPAASERCDVRSVTSSPFPGSNHSSTPSRFASVAPTRSRFSATSCNEPDASTRSTPGQPPSAERGIPATKRCPCSRSKDATITSGPAAIPSGLAIAYSRHCPPLPCCPRLSTDTSVPPICHTQPSPHSAGNCNVITPVSGHPGRLICDSSRIRPPTIRISCLTEPGIRSRPGLPPAAPPLPGRQQRKPSVSNCTGNHGTRPRNSSRDSSDRPSDHCAADPPETPPPRPHNKYTSPRRTPSATASGNCSSSPPATKSSFCCNSISRTRDEPASSVSGK